MRKAGSSVLRDTSPHRCVCLSYPIYSILFLSTSQTAGSPKLKESHSVGSVSEPKYQEIPTLCLLSILSPQDLMCSSVTHFCSSPSPYERPKLVTLDEVPLTKPLCRDRYWIIPSATTPSPLPPYILSSCLDFDLDCGKCVEFFPQMKGRCSPFVLLAAWGALGRLGLAKGLKGREDSNGDAIPSAHDFVRGGCQTVAVLGDYLYIDGGQITERVNGSAPADSPAYNGGFLPLSVKPHHSPGLTDLLL